MTIDKAIALLADSAYAGITTFDQDFKDAEKLGIEALKFRQQCKKTGFLYPPLPGETEG